MALKSIVCDRWVIDGERVWDLACVPIDTDLEFVIVGDSNVTDRCWVRVCVRECVPDRVRVIVVSSVFVLVSTSEIVDD